MKARVQPVAPRPRLVTPQRQSLGDMLQRLALIAPTELHAIAKLTRDVLKHAELRHKRYLGHTESKQDAS